MGELSKLLLEIAQVPEDDLGSSWREPLQPGDVVGRYEIRREIGRGGFGAVYEAFDPQLGRTVALKALKPGRSRHLASEEWIQKEAEAVAKLDHPAIVTIHDVGRCPAGAYLVMELLRGETLSARIGKGPLPIDDALRIAEQMAEGLAHAHSRGVLHRDLKPSNVFVCEDGRVKLLDFGLAHLLGTPGSSGAGTPAYMAPEQAAGAVVDERVDVWAAGMVLGEMLTGKRPVERTPSPEPGAQPAEPKTELMWEAPKAEPQPAGATAGPRLAGVPRPVAKVMGAALSEDPAARPKDGKAWLSELRSARLRVDRPRRLRRLALVGTAFLLLGLAVAGLATWRLWERQIPGGRVTVAVADFVNETGEQELDGLSGLLITSLEQSSALRVLTRSRMFDVLKQLGKEGVERIDEPLAREVGKHSRVRALLLASVRKTGDAYVVEMRALDPLLDEYVFTVKDRAANKREVLDLVDRLGTTTRSKLGEPRSTEGAQPQVASMATTNLKAWNLIFQSRRAIDLVKFEEAHTLASAALAEDPGSPLAKYQVFVAAEERHQSPGWDKKAVVAKARAEAEAVAKQLPEKERLILRLHRAFEDRKPELMDPLCEQLTSAYPLDKDILVTCGSIRFQYFYADKARAVDYLIRAIQLDPSYDLAVLHLCYVLATLGGAEQHLDLLRARAALAGDDWLMTMVGRTLFSARAEQDARALFQRLQEKRGRPYTSPDVAIYLAHIGRPEEAERIARSCLEGLSQLPERERTKDRNACTDVLISALMAQGRVAEAMSTANSWPVLNPIDRAVFRVDLYGAGGALEEARAAAHELSKLGLSDNPEAARSAGLILVIGAGLVEEAAPILEKARASQSWEMNGRHSDLVFGNAVADWVLKVPGAEGRLRAEADTPHLGGRYHAARILARHLRMQGKCTEVVPLLEGLRVLPPSIVIAGRPEYRAQHTQWLAECYERLGDIPKARERNDEFLRLWARADADLPLLIEAKAIRERLARATDIPSSPR
jgi:serine/threonine protein kinase/tetratricopeptide (TPR) repeat protein